MKFNIFDINHNGQLSKSERRIQTLATEVLRFFCFGIPCLLLITQPLPDLLNKMDVSGVMFVVKNMLGYFILIALLSHYMRKMFFPYINLRVFSAKASEESLASSIVFLSVCLLLVGMFISAAILVK